MRGAKELSVLADKCRRIVEVKEIHGQMIRSCLISDQFAASRLLAFAALSPAGNLTYAVKLFETTKKPNAFMYNTLIRATSLNNPNKTLSLYARMRHNNTPFDARYTLSFLLKGIFGIQLCQMLHAEVLKFGVGFDFHVGDGLVRCYCESGQLGFARKVFDGLRDRGIAVWGSMLFGYVKDGSRSHGEAVRVFEMMLRERGTVSQAVLVSVLNLSKSLELGEKVRVYIEESGVEIGVILGTALIDMYAKNGEIGKARGVFDGMEEKNVASWNAMICGLGLNGEVEEAFELFRRMDVVPNDITLVGVLSACCHAGLVDVGWKIFDSMEAVYGIVPKIEHYGCVVDLLGRAGKVVEAEEVLLGMGWKPDVRILGALLSACQSYGNIEVAERVVEKIVELDKRNHGGYVVLSNMYAKAGRWGDVLRLRKVIRKGKLKKIPGWSHVDNDN